MFPSPQGGSETRLVPLPSNFQQLFPSPQGGSETYRSEFVVLQNAEFPSPQGGSETFWGMGGELQDNWFPSPQGGSETASSSPLFALIRRSFHPLKAGRRPSPTRPVPTSETSFHPLKAGRRRSNKLSSSESSQHVSIPSRRVGDLFLL